MKQIITILSVGLALTVSACETDTTPESDLAVDDTTEVVPSSSDIERFSSHADARLSDLDDDLQVLETRLETVSADARDEMQETITEAREKRERLAVLRDSLSGMEPSDAFYDLRDEWNETFAEVDKDLAEARMEAAETRDEFSADLNDELNELDQEIAEKRAEMANLDDSARVKYDEQLAALEERRNQFKAELDSLGEATEEGWKDLKSDMMKGWDEIKDDLATVRIPVDRDEANELDNQQ